jgi:hypothetical protein
VCGTVSKKSTSYILMPEIWRVQSVILNSGGRRSSSSGLARFAALRTSRFSSSVSGLVSRMKVRSCSPNSVNTWSTFSAVCKRELASEAFEGLFSFEGPSDTTAPLETKVDSTSFVSANQNPEF